MTSLYSARWHRVASLQPALSPQLRARRQWVRGECWHVYLSPAGRAVRLNGAAHAVAARLDGRRTVQAVWDAACARHDDPPTQEEVIDLLAQLREAGLLSTGGAGAGAGGEQEQAPAPARGSLIAWRITLGDPMPLLRRLRPAAALFGRGGAVAWGAAMLCVAVLLLQHLPPLWAHGQQALGTPRMAWIGVLLYVPLKLVHEAAHGLAVLRFGGTVPRWGVTLMWGLPVPWVDASAAHAFASAGQRVTVGAAGMMAELALASIALALWLALPDGTARDVAFMILVLAGLSSVLFNANPLQKLDGYHIATDLLGLPNLAARSARWWREALVARLRGRPPLEPMALAPGEAKWLCAYAPLAWGYTVAIVALAATWAAAMSTALAVAIAVVLGAQVVLRPAAALAAALRRESLLDARGASRWRRAVMAGVGVIAGALLLPLPKTAVVQGVIWPHERAELRAAEGGFVQALVRADGDTVAAGDTVLQLSHPALAAARGRQASRVAGLESQLLHAIQGAAGDARAADLQADLDDARAELARLDERVAALDVKAAADGRLALPQPADLAQGWVAQGQLVGHVVGDEPPAVRVAVPEAQAAGMDNRGVSVRLASDRGVVHAGRVVRDARGAVAQLPSAALSQAHGGPVATDPADRSALKPLKPVVLLDVHLLDAHAAPRLGERAWVRFETTPEPLLVRGARLVVRALWPMRPAP